MWFRSHLCRYTVLANTFLSWNNNIIKYCTCAFCNIKIMVTRNSLHINVELFLTTHPVDNIMLYTWDMHYFQFGSIFRVLDVDRVSQLRSVQRISLPNFEDPKLSAYIYFLNIKCFLIQFLQYFHFILFSTVTRDSNLYPLSLRSSLL